MIKKVFFVILVAVFQIYLPRPAHAIIGRPLTPLSFAGVARRTTRRAVYAGAAYGAYAAPVVAAPIAARPVVVW